MLAEKIVQKNALLLRNISISQIAINQARKCQRNFQNGNAYFSFSSSHRNLLQWYTVYRILYLRWYVTKIQIRNSVIASISFAAS